MGRKMSQSSSYPDNVMRLFRRGTARFSADLVHERVVCEDPVGPLREELTHHPVARIEDTPGRVDRYSSAGAKQLVVSGRRVLFICGFLHGLWTFLRTYVIRAGFLHGREGLLLAILNAEGSYHRYMKAWQLQRRSGGSHKPDDRLS